MNSKEFSEYVNNCGINWNQHQKLVITSFINCVYEIEYLEDELKINDKYQYFKGFMLPEDYRRILLDLKGFRMQVFFKRLKEEKKRLKKVNTSTKDSFILIKDFAYKQAKQLKLKLSIDKKGEFIVK